MEQDISHTRGDTFNRTIKFTDASGALDITGSTVVFSIKKQVDDATPYFTKTFTISNPTEGEAVLTITATESKSFEIGTYVYDIQWTDSNGNVKTVLKGNFTVTYDVTI